MFQRAFDFEGNDRQYIKHLERELLRARRLNSHLRKFVPISNAVEPSPGSIRFIQWKPDHTSQQVKSKWMEQLDAFIDGIPAQDHWQEARVKAGIDTLDRNQHALKLILGHAGPAIFHHKYETMTQPLVPPVESCDLVVRGCEYGRFIAWCRHDRNFAVTVAAFQNLVFCSYCVVMMRAGVSKDTTNDTMRRYTGQDQKDHTLATYRNGAVWVNRCIAALLKNGWGHRSWEIFLLSTCSQPFRGSR